MSRKSKISFEDKLKAVTHYPTKQAKKYIDFWKDIANKKNQTA